MLRAAAGCTTKRVWIDFRQRQACVSFAARNRPAVGPTEPSGQWMPGSSSPVVSRNTMIRRIKSQKKKFMCKRITVLKQMELLRELSLEKFY